MIQNLNEELFSFIKKSPTGFHAVHELANYLTEAGFERLAEGNTWNLAEGGKYFVTRNQSAIIAFKVSRKDYSGFHIAASHSDSPTLKIKESSEMNIENQYVKLNVEKYGGMLCAPWFDRPLSVAGRIIVKDGNRLTTKLINVDRDLLMIPNLAIHMNREVNDGYKYNIQKDMLPLYRMSNSGKAFKEMIAEEAGVSVDQIKGMDLFLYNRMEGTVWGCDGEFISAPRLDDLQCAFTSTMALLNSESDRCIPVVAVFDNEEVGSGTKQGAGSTFLYDILRRIKQTVNIPVIMKLGDNLTNPVVLIDQLYANGAAAVVLFNRFYQPDINIEKMEHMSGEIFSNASDLANPLRWIGIASAVVDKIDYAASGGVANAESVVKAILAGASAVEVCSAVYLNTNAFIGEANRFLSAWMERKGFENIAQFKGKLNIKDIKGVNTFERTQFLKYFGKKE